jgi:hypothetical protein
VAWAVACSRCMFKLYIIWRYHVVACVIPDKAVASLLSLVVVMIDRTLCPFSTCPVAWRVVTSPGDQDGPPSFDPQLLSLPPSVLQPVHLDTVRSRTGTPCRRRQRCRSIGTGTCQPP